MASSAIPLITEFCAAASPRITARIGPTHGVQPKAKAKPMTNAPQGLLPPFTWCMRLSASKARIFRMPVRCSPKRMMTTPAISASSALYCVINWPTSVATAPSATNTMPKPRLNMSELRITLGINPLPPRRNSSTPTPDINDTYPGTRGKTQGERNETSPAANAAMGDTDDIVSILFAPALLGYWPRNKCVVGFCPLRVAGVPQLEMQPCPPLLHF